MEQFHRPRRETRPDTPLEEIFPKDKRRAEWFQFEKLLQWSVPALDLPKLLSVLIFFPAVITYSGIIIGLFITEILRPRTGPGNNGGPYDALIGLTILGAPILWGILFYYSTKPFATRFPGHCKTLGDLTRMILGRNFKQIVEGRKGFTESDVWETLKAIIVDEIGVKPEDVVPDARFVADLGVS